MILPLWNWFIWIIIGINPATLGYPSVGAQLERAQRERPPMVALESTGGARRRGNLQYQ